MTLYSQRMYAWKFAKRYYLYQIGWQSVVISAWYVFCIPSLSILRTSARHVKQCAHSFGSDFFVYNSQNGKRQNTKYIIVYGVMNTNFVRIEITTDCCQIWKAFGEFTHIVFCQSILYECARFEISGNPCDWCFVRMHRLAHIRWIDEWRHSIGTSNPHRLWKCNWVFNFLIIYQWHSCCNDVHATC